MSNRKTNPLYALKDRYAVVGVGTTPYGSFPSWTNTAWAHGRSRTPSMIAAWTRIWSTAWASAAYRRTPAWARCWG